jgi:hypothetical protein
VARLEFLKFPPPRLVVRLHLLYLSDEHGHVLRPVNGQPLELPAGLLQLQVKLTHVVGDSHTELVEDILVPLVILVVHLRLNTAIVDCDRTEGLLRL